MADSKIDRNATTSAKEHNVRIESRKLAHLTGVNDVKSFDENEIVIDTTQGLLLVQGSSLHVKALAVEKGEAKIEGKIDRFVYSDKKLPSESKSVLSRMFR